MKLKKILNFSLVNCSIHILKIPFLIFALIFSLLLPAQDNGFFEKTRIQHKINEASGTITYRFVGLCTEEQKKSLELFINEVMPEFS